MGHFQNQLKHKAKELGKAGTLAIEHAAAKMRQEAKIRRLNLRLGGVQIEKHQTSSPPKLTIDEAEESQVNTLKADLVRTYAQLEAAWIEMFVLGEEHTKTLQSCSAIKRQSRQTKTSLYARTTRNSELEVEISCPTSELQEVKAQLDRKDIALATASGEYSKLQKTHNDGVALCQQTASDSESRQNDLRALESKVDGLNSLIVDLQGQKSTLLANLPEDAGFIPTGNRGWRTIRAGNGRFDSFLASN